MVRTRVLRVGDLAPAFALPSTSGEVIRLEQLRGRRVVVYFYPKDDTPGCTKEACGFHAESAAFARLGVVVVGVSGDSVESHQRFAKKFGLAFPLLSDDGFRVCKAYGVYTKKSLYGRTSWGIERTTVVIDEDGRITAIFPKVRVDGHIQALLNALTASVAE